MWLVVRLVCIGGRWRDKAVVSTKRKGPPAGGHLPLDVVLGSILVVSLYRLLRGMRICVQPTFCAALDDDDDDESQTPPSRISGHA